MYNVFSLFSEFLNQFYHVVSSFFRILQLRETERDTHRERERERQTEKERERDREGETERDRERDRERERFGTIGGEEYCSGGCISCF